MTKTPEEIRVGQMATRFLLEGATSGGSVAVFKFDVTPGARLPAAHSHDRYEETIYGLAGVLTWTLEGQKHKVGLGEVLHIPRGAVHRFDNEGAVTAKRLAIVTPGILTPEYLREIGHVINAAAGGPPDPAAVSKAMRPHRLTLVA